MGSGLNAAAPEFRPASAPVTIPALPDDPFDLNNPSEVAVSPDELEELESVEAWVNMMAQIEEQEHEHLIALGLRYADKQKLHDLTTRVAALKYGRSKTSPGQQTQARWGKQRG
ncbi:hypothetical protein F751_3446 [Auxenochlorella protothecoides]|uniref:Uncharacterized protein n=1 Tax=Auxenochlorella protothecoides TaxID=3075 RepID=A0A087SC01_AUXPR|nr:hypothetical protein F751_3446 [Auxenochlorella protothecoides]KFM23255.1 hypothetical protein F751_3446 [Auxenochlorella protothecoides]RMZ53528.1 hypothetical protein APUTEX25_003350 [Auxenochlorella protothecoides]|eukprot:RMZ53528.1 hypothetical protein APUTEX25_003350 [Auxenochlorella protothecoides]